MPDFSSVLGLVWWGILLVCWGVVLIDAMKNGGGLHFLLCLIIPFYALYWAFFKQTMYRGPVVGLIGLNVIFTVVTAMGLVGGGKNSPCKLVAKADVEEALGLKVDGGDLTTTRDGDACTYNTLAEPKKQLIIAVSEGKQLNSMRNEDLPSGSFKVDNLGDDALSSGPVLIVQKGTTIFALSWASPKESRGSRSQETDAAYFTLEGRKKLARLALERYKP